MADQTPISFTPTEDLILDVLVARYRLGDTLWTFNAHNKRALRNLEEKGLVDTLSGVVEKTIRASLTGHALHTHGASWFQLGITLNHLPQAGPQGTRDTSWSKAHLEQLIVLPQQQGSVDPRAINSAHLLMLQMINRNHPVYQVSAGTAGAVMLTCGQDSVEIFAEGLSYRLTRRINTSVTTRLDEVLFFTSESVL